MENEKKGVLLWLRETIPKYLTDILAAAGGVAVVCGVAQIFVPAGWITGGAMLIATAVIYSKGGAP